MTRRMPSRPWSGRRLHFVGVGGAGMSGYARAAHALGRQVSGSDRGDSPTWSACAPTACCTRASIGHAAANVPAGADVEVVYSSAIAAREPRARSGARAGPARAPARGAAGRVQRAATHDRGGGHARQDDDLLDARARPARRRPGPRLARRAAESAAGLANAHWSDGEWLVVEADESDRSMLSLARRDRGADERRAGPPRDVGRWASCARPSARSSRRAPQAVVWDRPELLAAARQRPGASPTTRADADAARGPGLAFPLARARGASGGAGRAQRAATRPARWRPPAWPARTRRRAIAAWRTSTARAGAFARLGAGAAGRACTRTTPTTRRGRGDAARRAHARAAAAGGGVPAAPVLPHRAARARVRRGARAGGRRRRHRRVRRARARRGPPRRQRPAGRAGGGGRGARAAGVLAAHLRRRAPVLRTRLRAGDCAW